MKELNNKQYLVIIIVISFTFLTYCSDSSIDSDSSVKNNININKKVSMEHLTKETFKEKVYNFEKNKEWKYEGNLPCIIDFYADWCRPCKMIAPVLEELANEYKGKIIIYKVNTEEEQELAGMFGIKSIPSILFCPKKGQPQMAMGALPKQSFISAINDILLK